MSRPAFRISDLGFHDDGPPRYEQLARSVEQAILDGLLVPGERLPTVRRLSAELGVSATTITSAFELLSSRGLIRAEVGRGTFIQEPARPATAADPGSVRERIAIPLRRSAPVSKVTWRRRALMSASARLRESYSDALECSTGRPDPSLLPVSAISRAWAATASAITPRDLQYAAPDAIEPLAAALLPMLAADLVPARARDLLIGSSAQQLLVLALEVIAARSAPQPQPLIAVEEPGYPTILDTFERAGARLIGMAVDEFGAVPESLAAALAQGAKGVLFTTRGHNPTGASWSPERVAQLADVLADFPDVMAIEDDQFAGVASTRPGTLLADPRTEAQTLYIRSFSKSIAPDLRLAVAVARPALRDVMAEAKSFADGWTSRLLQRVLAFILTDEELPGLLAYARDTYGQRRKNASEAINALLLPQGGTWSGFDGVNLWVQLPEGVDARELVEHSAAAGVRIADGEAFFLAPGHANFVRLNAGSVSSEAATRAGRLLAESALACGRRKPGPIHV